MIFILYTFLVDCAHLARTPLSTSAKLQIFLAYLATTLFLPIAQALKITKISFLGLP